MGQVNFIPKKGPRVIDLDGEELTLAWFGGLNFCQISLSKLNNDTLDDIWIFDRSGNRNLGLIAQIESDSIIYVLEESLIGTMPNTKSWTLLRDYDGDGWRDLFSASSQGISVKRRIPFSFRPQFEDKIELLKSKLGQEQRTIIVNPRDIPGIEDVDMDGDLDILTFDPAGFQLEFHENKSAELYGHNDSLAFELTNPCWGKFEENEATNEVRLNIPCEEQQTAIGRSSLHAGSTIAVFDYNLDQRNDLLLGDISFSNLVLLINGQEDEPIIVDQDARFPSGLQPVDLPIFPAAFVIDLDQDGMQDLLVSPNGQNVSENKEGIWFYRRNNSVGAPEFELKSTSLFQNQMLDVGEGARPVLYDFDKDGDQDLLIANYGEYGFPNYHSKWHLLKYDETNQQFILSDTNWQDISRFDLDIGLHPTFGDINDDGKLDALVGRANGTIAYLTDISSSQNIRFELINSTFQGIDIGLSATPQLIDLNDDGLLDMVVGERNGNLNLFMNEGTKENPFFALKDEKWGNVAVGAENFGLGFSVPHIFFENAKPQIWVGSFEGIIYHYSNVSVTPNTNFHLAAQHLEGLGLGSHVAAVRADYNKDGKAEMILGNYGGGLNWLEADKVTLTSPKSPQIQLSIHPNPVEDYLEIELKAIKTPRLKIFDLAGKLLYSKALNQSTTRLKLSDLGIPPGIFLIQIENMVQKMIKLSQ